MIKLWGGSGKRTAKNKEKRSREASPEYNAQNVQSNEKEHIIAKPKSEGQANNVLDFEALSKMYNEYKSAQYTQLAAVGNETTQTIYTKKQQSLKFLSL